MDSNGKDLTEILIQESKSSERESDLVSIIESLRAIETSSEWRSLKSKLFGPLLEKLESSLENESKKTELRPSEIYRLQGQIIWARRYSDLDRLSREFHTELINIRKRNPPTERE